MKTHSAARAVQSYLALKPSKARLILAEKGQPLAPGWVINKPGNFIHGRLGKQRIDVFTRPERLLEDFVNVQSDPKDILRFTRHFGVLRERARDRHYYLPEEQDGYELGEEFLIPCERWFKDQQKFRHYWEQASSGGQDLAALLSNQLRLESFSRTGPVTELRVVSGPRGFGLQLEPGDLWQAVCLIFINFWNRLRKCQNPNCSRRPYFIYSRRDQKYCDEGCSRLVANRRWWNEHGEDWRRKWLSRKKRKQRKRR